MIIMTIIMISMVWGTIYLLITFCPLLAIVHASVSLSLILSVSGIIRANNRYVKHCDSIADMERSAFNFDDDEAVKVISDNVPNLDFKFHRD